ncbi:MAG: hypothetical protein HY401_03105 [Elusimicrobia bacterium]|nr:hypothetical protein [Elusimicrobiota bacterium]
MGNRAFLFFLFFTIPYSLFPVPSLRAQFEFQMGVTPGALDYADKSSTGQARYPIDPFAQALADELTKTKATDYWTIIGLSTATPAQDVTLYIRRGFGRSEIVILMFIAEKAKNVLKELAHKRVEGARLRELALQHQIPYDSIRSQALSLKEKIERQLRLKPKDEPPVSSTGTVSGQSKQEKIK